MSLQVVMQEEILKEKEGGLFAVQGSDGWVC